jgi:hypothetical protein
MIELVFIVLLNHLANWGLSPIIATRAVAADGDALRALLSDPANQWRLAASFAEVAALQPVGDRCEARLRLPMGLRMHASLHVEPTRTGRLLTSEVLLGRRTVAWATWILTPDRGTTEVDLAIQPESRRLLTRLALLLGGRRCIAGRLDTALATLATTAARAVEDVVAPAAADAVLRHSACAGELPLRPSCRDATSRSGPSATMSPTSSPSSACTPSSTP